MRYAFLLLVIFCADVCFAQSIKLVPANMNMIQVTVTEMAYKGKKGVKVLGTDFTKEEMAILKGTNFTNGTIELDVSGDRLPGSDTSFRGFIGLAFRVQQKDENLGFECFYIRPTLGRSQDQLKRNHSVQYVSSPGYNWPRLRSEAPGVYESYADMLPGEWVHLKIVVKDSRALLYVNNADQPTLIINDLKQSITAGALALWIGPGTEGYFSNLTIDNKNPD